MTTASLVEEFLRGLALGDTSPEREAILRTLVTRLVDLVALDPDDGDLKVAATVLDELLEAANVFSPWRDHPKLTVFGSARTRPGTPLYQMAAALGAAMAAKGWITVSGAGPGIMEAAARGAGRENTLGVNVELPFEQSANPYVDAETRLVEMKYFFTRKVALTKESIAFAIFPGGLGTMDETFEILTLLHTGKSTPAPVILVDTPDGDYWDRWLEFVEGWMIGANYLDAQDTCLFRICRSVEETIDEVERFYSNYIGFELSAGLARVALRRAVTPALLGALRDAVPAFATGAGYRVDDAGLLTFDFDGRQYVDLRRVIDVVNADYWD
ncbi:MAG: TIGR00730 family Rossman fold protein [Acidimicrobiales bacterium]